jgi:dolichol-phosphate mannosyltransferase
MSVKYSIVVPLKNEADNVEALVKEIEEVMPAFHEPWELICIDDGSTDSTVLKLKSMKESRTHLRIILFKKNFGQSSAFDAGFKAAKGKIIITMDGDLQNDPHDIPKLVHALDDGYDLVCGMRKKRNDPWTKRWISKLANSVRSRFCHDGISDTGCSLKAYRRESLKSIKLYQGMHRFLPALFQIEGFRILEIPVAHRPRLAGKTKYNFLNRSFNTVIDMLAVRWMSNRQLRYEIDKELS